MFDGGDAVCSSFLAIWMAIEFADIPGTEAEHFIVHYYWGSFM